MINPFQYLYGPIYSWRLGRSLGIDPLSDKHKICNMDCVYCQLGATGQMTESRREYVPTASILEEIKRLPPHFVDYLTFSGRGEPTLAKNLGDMVHQIKSIRHEKIAVITNSILMSDESVQEDLMEVDFVLAKLDASNQRMFENVGKSGIDFECMVKGMLGFRNRFQGKFGLQIMLIPENLENLAQLAQVARGLEPDEVQLNTPLRPCAVKPIERVEMQWAKKFFEDMPVVTVWDANPKDITPFDESATVQRHGHYRKTGNGL